VRFAWRAATGTPTAAILGMALDASGAPLRSRNVVAFSGAAVALCAPTDFQGSFAIGPLPDGEYGLGIEGFLGQGAPLPQVTVAGGEDVFPVVLNALPEDGSSVDCPLPQDDPDIIQSASVLAPALLHVVSRAASKPAVSEDPNTKEGPDEAVLSPGMGISYTIRFENIQRPGVTAAANRIVVIDALDPKLEVSTVSLSDGLLGKDDHFELSSGGGFGRNTGYSDGTNKYRLQVSTDIQVSLTYPEEVASRYPSESLLASISGTVVTDMEQVLQLTQDLCGVRKAPCDMDPSECGIFGMFSRLQGELCGVVNDLAEGKPSIVWVLQGRVLLTKSIEVGDYYFDDSVGILPPNNEEHRGEGYVSMDVGVKATAAEGDVVNRARIIFDNNDAIWTESVRHSVAKARPHFIRGDCNGDGRFGGETADIIALLSYNFLGGAEPPCLAACDANGDGNVLGITQDAIYILNYLFLGTGPPPAPPFPACGEGTRGDYEDVGCESYPACR
jgi:hypothetical protein